MFEVVKFLFNFCTRENVTSNLRRTNIFNLQVLSNDCNHCQYENMGERRKAYSKIRSLTVFHLKIFHRLFFR